MAAAADSAKNKVRWGILGAAKIARDRVIPALQASAEAEVVAVASRSAARAKETAAAFGIPRAHGSYEELLADPAVDVIYNPLPNHLHVPWSVRAAEAGKHVLCEKPIAMDAREARALLAARDRTGRLIQEAVMVRTHPRWIGARAAIRAGRIGELRAVVGFFSYSNTDPANVRNDAQIGGGGLYDIGFYPITMSRFLFEAEPERVLGIVERDPQFGIDRLTSALLAFPGGAQATFTCATQLSSHQALEAYGTRGRMEVRIPWSFPPDRPSPLVFDDGSSLTKANLETITFDACDQFQVQGDLFSRAVRAGGPAPVPLEDAVANMQVIDAIFRSARSGHWESPRES